MSCEVRKDVHIMFLLEQPMPMLSLADGPVYFTTG